MANSNWEAINSDVYQHRITGNKIVRSDSVWIHINQETGIQTPLEELADNPIKPFGFNPADVDYSQIPTDGGDW